MSTIVIAGAVIKAIEELRQSFPDAIVTFVSDEAGGAWVNIDSVPLGPAYVQATSFIAFQITFPYPEADIYPLFVRADLQRKDGQAHGEGFQQQIKWGMKDIVTGEETVGTQLSRRSNRLDPTIDTAATKVLKVLKWLGEQ